MNCPYCTYVPKLKNINVRANPKKWRLQMRLRTHIQIVHPEGWQRLLEARWQKVLDKPF